ncbi:MAG: carboxymuconolactone decarboxylase family protein [Bacteroidetes bacterium]|nr:MAG: carboxymuconolactone decarboxylase family protein [Bacteroidota bacterium]
MEQSKPSMEQMLKMMAEELGETPLTMKNLAKLNEKIVREHAANKQFAMSGDQIPLKYKLLMSLAISAALGVENCIDTYTKVALRKGISPEEILEAIVLARFVKGTTVISTSTSAMQLVIDHLGK